MVENGDLASVATAVLFFAFGKYALDAVLEAIALHGERHTSEIKRLLDLVQSTVDLCSQVGGGREAQE